MRNYNLGFISDEDIFNHVKNTVSQYRRSINLQEFNKNIIDPIKLTFDSKIYGQTIRQTIESECIRQIDKTNNNCIGYFHQNLFKHAGHGWEVPAKKKKKVTRYQMEYNSRQESSISQTNTQGVY